MRLKIFSVFLFVFLIALLFYIYYNSVYYLDKSQDFSVQDYNIIVGEENSEANFQDIEEYDEKSVDIVLSEPISHYYERVTKKPFGIKVSLNDSPVVPENFTGYHTGVDFEVFSGEEGEDIVVSAICDGEVVYKGYVSGYGGVLIHSCLIEDEYVTVLYGHLRLSSILKEVGDEVLSGSGLGFLGAGYSDETSGERKHLHLGIHKGNDINFLGYVDSPEKLSDWIDVMEYINY